MQGGHQSRVFRMRRGADDLVVKLTDPRHVDAEEFVTRIGVVAEVERLEAAVVGPVPLLDDLTTPVGGWLAVGYPYVAGEAPNADRADDADRMADVLASLHRSLAQLPHHDLPPVAALRIGDDELLTGRSQTGQLLHGDYSSSNLRVHRGRVRILDFDDCGYGPVEFDIGNALYMVLFDATIIGDPARYERFRDRFVISYVERSGAALTETLLDEMIDRRRAALRHWLDHLDDAPIGIRTSSPGWRQKLRAFADGP